MKTFIVITLAAAFAAAGLAGCLGGGGGERQVFTQEGSSTVLPIALAWAEAFPEEGADFVVKGGGTGTGIEAFCDGRADIADASRPMKGSEADICRGNGIDPFEVQVAVDGLAVVVDKDNTFVDHLTVNELNLLWTADETKQVTHWNDLRPSWPDAPIVLYGPGTDSGTYDYFVEVIIEPIDGDDTTTRSDYTPSEDDNFLVQGVSGSPNGLAFFGLSYAVKNAGKVRIVPIDDEQGDEGPVAPTTETIVAGDYQPLARPLFMYTDGAPTGVLREYFEWGLSDEGQGIVDRVGYVQLSAGVRAEMLDRIGGG